MKKSILIPILAISVLAVISGTSVGLLYAFSPADDSELSVVSVTTQSNTDTVTVILKCEGNQSGNTHRFKRNFAYMHQVQFNNSDTNETMLQQQIQFQWRHRIQAGKNLMYQYQIEGLEQGQMLQLRIVYNNGKVLTYNFQVQS